jgi:hypothetical protein
MACTETNDKDVSLVMPGPNVPFPTDTCAIFSVVCLSHILLRWVARLADESENFGRDFTHLFIQGRELVVSKKLKFLE